MDVIAARLKEVLDESYLKHRIESCAYLGMKLEEIGVPIVRPVGGHAVFIDAKKFLPHIKPLNYPAQALAIALYIEGGIRSVEIGSFMFGRQPDGSERAAKHELLRLAMSRRVYSKSHFDYVAKLFNSIALKKQTLKGLRLVK